MKNDLLLPPPGAEEPEGKRGLLPGAKGRLGEKPVLPPPAKPLGVSAQTPPRGDGVVDPPPLFADAPPPVFKVDGPVAPGPAPMKPERSKSGVSRTVSRTKSTKKKKRDAVMMDDEVAVVARDPRRPREE